MNWITTNELGGINLVKYNLRLDYGGNLLTVGETLGSGS